VEALVETRPFAITARANTAIAMSQALRPVSGYADVEEIARSVTGSRAIPQSSSS
jgi:hypothetical protein